MIQLTTQQNEYYKGIKWLLQDGPRAQGKTYLMSLAFLERAAADLYTWVYVYDHFNTGGSNRSYLFGMINHVFQSSTLQDEYVLQVNELEHKIRLVYKEKKK